MRSNINYGKNNMNHCQNGWDIYCKFRAANNNWENNLSQKESFLSDH